MKPYLFYIGVFFLRVIVCYAQYEDSLTLTIHNAEINSNQEFVYFSLCNNSTVPIWVKTNAYSNGGCLRFVHTMIAKNGKIVAPTSGVAMLPNTGLYMGFADGKKI